jgi:cytochrome c-type protein NapB
MMKQTLYTSIRLRSFFALFCFVAVITGPFLSLTWAQDKAFDSGGEAIFKSYDNTTQTYMSADSGDRNLVNYYKLRQYPGSPPRIPHHVEPSFSKDAVSCLSCHESGGFSSEHNAFIPITPHPEKELCYQCHVPARGEDKNFVENDWVSITPPRLGRSQLPGSPPPIPHSLQMRENCISCHTGPGAVVEIRVEHSSRGNCRQCHVPMVQTEPVKEFTRGS